MYQIKTSRAQRLAKKLPMATREIWEMIPEELVQNLTAKQLAMVMDLMDRSYHNGRASAGAEVIDDSKTNGAVYVNCIGLTIEWNEEGAEYEIVTEEANPEVPYSTRRTYSRKIKDGHLIVSIA